MILAAGLGTRLRPITYTIPKPMLPVGGRPLIAWLVDSLVAAGTTEIIVNLHHLPQPIESYLPAAFPNIHFHFSYEPAILGTGGGLRNVRALLESEEDFFLMNGDTLQRPTFEDLRRARRDQDAIAALTLRHPPAGDRYTAVWEENGLITGYGQGRGRSLMFSGSHCIASRVFRYIPDRDVSDMTGDVYQPLVKSAREKVAAVLNDDPMWFDIGTPQRYLTAARALGNMIGKSVIEGDARDSIVADDCFIARGVVLESCIVAHGVEMRTPMELKNAVICKDDPAIPRDPAYRFENGLVIACI
ncbi:MAG: nucleotidyltransferase family protein [Acidobacteriota bacterium]|nr:nucleotidyltransferase family protein [Acidobacteriota bacterium]